MSNALVAPHFQTPENAREWLEKLRWPEGSVCSHCGTIGRAYALKKPGWYRCAEKECRKDFTVTTGTVMERSHIPLNKWLMAFYLLNASKKGMSAHQLHRALKLDYKSAWFMWHRIREAMRSGSLGPLGGEGKIVEADETYYGPIDKAKVRTKTTIGRPFTKRGKGCPSNKRPIVALVERGGNVRTFHVPLADQATVEKIVGENIAHESLLHTDESKRPDRGADRDRGVHFRQAGGAMTRNHAPRVVLRATHEGALTYCSLADLKRFAVDLA
jgi:transposase-like protein